MKVAFDILRRDVAALARNPIAFVVVLALLVLPGLYAWYCIVANWDPYSNTSSMPIAVVNQDKGANNDLTGEINIGKQVVGQLEGNDSIDWRFYDSEDDALQDTRLGNVYATLVLPEDLSENLIGIFEGSSEKPTIYYYPNEKYSAVATKVTDSAAQTLIREINQGFSSTVNEKFLTSAQGVANTAEERTGEVRTSASAEITAVQAEIDKAVASLDDATSTVEGWRQAAEGTRAALQATSDQLPAIESMLSQASTELDALRTQTDGFEGQLSATILSSATTISNMSAQTSATIAQAAEDLAVVSERLAALREAAGSDEVLVAAVDAMDAAVTVAEVAVEAANVKVAEIDAKVQETTQSVSTATSQISNEVMPRLNTGSYELSTSLSGLSGALAQFEPQVIALQGVLAQTDSALADAQVAIADGKALLATVSTNLRGTVSDIGAIGKALELDSLSRLLNADPDNVGTFISSPVKMVTREVFPVSNYGTAVAPFYTNLALWIGCFILVSLIKVEVDSAGFERATARQRYFGRWLLLVILSLLQSQVICGVDILLGIDCANPALFMLSGAVCSFAYMNLIFALVKTFRNIGKTLCILLLIMQVPGSSGMYPIQMMPEFFQVIHPSLPFTYGISAMREALCGMRGLTYFTDLLMLLAIVPLSLLLALALRPIMANLLMIFDDEMRKTGFFASEEHAQGREERGLAMMRALASHDSFRDDIEERAIWLNRNYPRWRRRGSIALFALPFALLIVIFPFNVAMDVPTDTKLAALVFVLVLLLLVSFGLIALEYVHRTIEAEMKLIGDNILAEFEYEYETFMDRADDTRLAIEREEGHIVDVISDDLLKATPPLSAEVMAMIPDTSDTPGTRSAPSVPNASDIPDAPSAPRTPSALVIPAGLATSMPMPTPMRKRNTGAIRDIFFTDMRLGFQSVIGVVVIMLLVITPALYAWFNTAGSWDPYRNTGNLQVAVANEDEGYKGDLIPVTINIGDTAVSQLRENESFNWVFVGENEAIEGVEDGRYYAAIVIPSDFSTNMMTYIVEDASYPEVLYYTNEKENPIAPLITQKGANSIQENIRVSFTERVDEVALAVAYEVLDFVTNPNMSSSIAKMSRHLDDATGDTKGAARELRMLSTLSKTTSGIVDATGSALEGLKSAADSARVAMGSAQQGITDATLAFDQALDIVQSMLDGHELNVDAIQAIADAAFDLLQSGSEDVVPRIDRAIEAVELLKAEHPEVDPSTFDAVIDSLEKARQNASGVPGKIIVARANVDALIQNAKAEADETKAFFTNNIRPSVKQLSTTLSSIATSTSSVLDGLDTAVSGFGGSTGGLSNQLTSLSGTLVGVGDRLESSATRLENAKTRVTQALSSGDVQQIEDVILGNDPEFMAASLAVPVQEHREAIYAVSNFGSSMAPFYTVLSLWVGALVMISTMRVRVVEERIEELRLRYAHVSQYHEFFGRYGIFGFISLLQSALVLLGDVLFLHIQCDNPIAFLVCGIFIGQVFCIVVFTMTELFGDVGKALCVILLIMQVAASGGTFPAQMLDPLLSQIVPFLPFHYAMTMLQECVAGIYWPKLLQCFVALLALAGVSLVIGMPLSRPFRRLNDFFEHQLEKTGYM